MAFGPNMPGTGSVAHISGEYITLEHIYACIDIYKDAIARLAKLVRDSFQEPFTPPIPRCHRTTVLGSGGHFTYGSFM